MEGLQDTCIAVQGSDMYGPCEAEWEVMEEPWIALQSQLNQKKENNGGNLPHPIVTITVTGNFGGCDMSTEICQAAYRNIMAAARQMDRRMLGKAPNNGPTVSHCLGVAAKAKGVSIGLDVLGAIPAFGNAVSAGAGIVRAGIAVNHVITSPAFGWWPAQRQ